MLQKCTSDSFSHTHFPPTVVRKCLHKPLCIKKSLYWQHNFQYCCLIIGYLSNQFNIIRPKKKNCYVALSRPTVKCEKTGSGFFLFCFLCQIWAKNLLKFVFNGLKKHLHDLYMRFDCIPPEFSPFRNLKKNIGKLNSLMVRKKKI